MSDDLEEKSLAALEAAVHALGGATRQGQQEMTSQVAHALGDEVHLLAQAGTGTGKSLSYLIPSMIWAVQSKKTALVATATLALQAQLAHKDIPVAARAVASVLGREPRTQIVKGRSNYVCLLKIRDQLGGEQDSLLGGAELVGAINEAGTDATSALGAEVVALREWADDQAKSGGLADRDDAPSHSPRSWAQVSVPVRECLGANACPYGAECFVEESRARARQADLVITNHALLAINAMHGGTALPEFGPVIVDEAHELVSRVTGAASSELSGQLIERTAKRAGSWLDDDLATELLEVADTFTQALAEVEPGRITDPDSPAIQASAVVREVSRRAVSGLAPTSGDAAEPEQQQAASAMKEVFEIAERIAKLDEYDVVYLSAHERFGRQLNVAPLSVAGLMREKVLEDHSTVLTSATLTLGGAFESTAGSVGLRRADRIELTDEAGDAGNWRAIDVGSPFEYRKQGILYIASSLPNPGRDGIGSAALTELAELIWAADGRTLGLFASQRSAEAAADHLRDALPALKVMCQGQANLSELTRTFITDEHSVLVGTMSLWQGIDVPGDACRLVVIDKIPFPRPDDPLMQARQQAVTKAGGNGFMQVAASHAALLLAQGAGRLIRSSTDRGVVAVLDPRLAKARYGSFLKASLPPFWTTTDSEVAVQALQRLNR
ncbi:ATP-dependent DNA helicase [Propionimicrobium sp. PCR01-08-3]|uniref:ATP-dependent DNA helicase n=1 Tax=Propionimicrobium sp. PCR01-08-3 TaxID=3052086 RepID=UPI00255C8A03|nr:ATP-dependent DNA helicase [Propionimicrobium sp. PCR01-08-3]WIY83652.1 ATP-dependent DNA helicase [Propionimicrobium sp. PCR01-08-3]